MVVTLFSQALVMWYRYLRRRRTLESLDSGTQPTRRLPFCLNSLGWEEDEILGVTIPCLLEGSFVLVIISLYINLVSCAKCCA